MDLDGRKGEEEVRSVKGGEIIIGIDCMRKKSIFNKKERKRVFV